MREPWASRWPSLARISWALAIGDGAASNLGSGCTDASRIAINLGTEPLVIQRGQRIAQMVVQRVVRAQWREVDELPVSARHDGGFGHTDKE